MTAPPTHGRVYQGYPYINPLVIDPPSLDAETAAKWTNLPRNPLKPRRPGNNPDVTINVSGASSAGDRTNSNADSEANINQTDTQDNKPDLDKELDHRVYIDFPTNELGEYVDGDRREDSRSNEASSNFVEDTIFYDPFEDRRINVGQSPATSPKNGSTGPSGIHSPSTQAGGSSLDAQSPPSNRVPPFMTKESTIYRSPSSDDRFASSIPEQDFPEPPPAYTEIDRTPVQPTPPRTEVIVPERTNPTGLANPDRKLIRCPYCSVNVYTLAIRENGFLTHVLAVFFILLFAPLVLVVYCTDYFRYRNHYCPNCNQLVGYEVPMLCQDMVYTKAD
ncbi:uncharacterized protein LOC123879424 [Maniola jurtina]|uniref:uncharacterized protein LOC123879424 n=1 Tax=Maniola jurtina TaxID=191418 RepID=UPI001E68F62A|nr:uncharacterized protein LOC123879424 [Maniola jurtina]XP_045783082.1 uncharacterized protein LOC123879424 [Maniola jurtina]XP_045783083.1 uncharacterized protein LOC123879424 [Maniola jurtina]XP_045783084.1 uncharacterized protein LOC123879424 [Maniola jurtina]